jgi:hypothetical protein
MSCSTLGAAVVIACAIVLRLILIVVGWPATNGDEAIMDLIALHIVEKGEHPVFFYGQHYLGPLEAYVGALLFHFLDVSLLSMRLGALLFYSGFLICMYFITSRIYSRSLALITVGLLGLGSMWVFNYQLDTTGYTMLPCLCALLFLLSYQLVCGKGDWYWRAILYLLWGLVAGLATWADLTVIPYVLVSGLLLVVEWRSLVKFGLWFLLIGFILGAFPLINYNLHAVPGTNSLSIFLSISQLGASNHYPLASYINSTFVITLPATLGLGPSCYIGHIPIVPLVYPHTRTCLIAQEVYGFGYLVLLIIAGIMACAALFISRCHPIRQESLQHWARLMLVIGAGLTLLGAARGSSLVYAGVIGVRYLICTLVSLPAVLWALWKGLDYVRKLFPQKWEWITMVLRLGMVSILFFISIDGTVHTFEQIPAAQANQQQLVQLADGLEALHVTRFYAEYWTCNRLIFQTQEQLVCADTWPDLIHGFDRYMPYRTMVDAYPNPDFVYAKGSGRIPELEAALNATHTPYRRFEVAGYMIYLPAHRIPGVKLYEN